MVAGPPVIDASIRDALVAALVARGCPAAIARELSRQARVDHDGSRFGLLVLNGHGTAVPADRDGLAYAVEHLAMNTAADNAEAVDRTARGEPGWTPYWPLRDRSPRR